ncbi:hypothetical protein CHLNCDRAFT_142594 [Chlorella variabilis]|uniref:Thylakoid lumen n=1 Tax=Chlorella variabilis TaxID=554065 RepID=E1ZTZ0_CHLVA|nr:hypothetical protein CHLNCDRAFT_142594 [Chlorella variabilis]EFN50711.1 hypothetical protein CHLNCDRAFT_142594 [Chlorella variabilis]|eukprot:XP_005842823.1 hypothetical protein CHLNCDRAFT_142594 [Chlorella variabilis]
MQSQESKNILEGFFIGRALAETVNERLGAALGDALAEFGKWDAETRQAIREFQEEVMERAQREMLAAAGASDASSSAAGGGSGGGSSVGLGGAAAAPDLPALVDELRAEVAATRAVVQQLKLKQQQQGQPPLKR